MGVPWSVFFESIFLVYVLSRRAADFQSLSPDGLSVSIPPDELCVGPHSPGGAGRRRGWRCCCLRVQGAHCRCPRQRFRRCFSEELPNETHSPGGGRAVDGVGGVVVAGFEGHIVDVLVNGSIDVFRKSYRMKLTLQGEDVPSTGLVVLSSLVSGSAMSMSLSTVPSVFSGRAAE